MKFGTVGHVGTSVFLGVTQRDPRPRPKGRGLSVPKIVYPANTPHPRGVSCISDAIQPCKAFKLNSHVSEFRDGL